VSSLAGTLRLTRLALRRDRVTVPVWIAGLTAFLAATSAMFVNTLATREDIVQEAALPTESVGLRMLGLTSGPSVGGAVMVRDHVLLSVLAALMSVLVVVRHTRQSEELGRADVVGATVVGRSADLAAALLVAAGANLVLAVALAGAMVANGLPLAGAFAAGSSIAGVGLVFAGVAAVAAQLVSTARAAIGLSSAVLAAAFVLSGVGNMLGTADTVALRVESDWPAWLSPIGWAQQTRPFGGDHVELLGLFLLAFAVLAAGAHWLVGRRDVGAGVWPPRRGPAYAGRTLPSSTGLRLRLQRGALAGWAVGALGFGLIFGAMTEQIQHVEGKSLAYYDRFGGHEHLTQAWHASMASMTAMFIAVYLVQMVLRIHADEVDGTLESLLGSGVTRARWIAGHLANGVGGVVLLLALYGVGTGVAAGLAVGDTATQVADVLSACLAQLPAILLIGAVALAAVCLAPRSCGPIAWAAVIFALVAGPIFGPPLRLPRPVLDLSPFTHVPAVPAASLDAVPLLALAALCLVLTGAALAAIRRRDLRLPA
jgi:ABC-2 type transport system permease protein